MRFRAWIMKRNPIFGSHWQRIGLLRIIPGALAMYLLIPVFIFMHLICLKLIYNTIICPLLAIDRIDLRQYIVFDRHIIAGLSWTGRFHCVYCEYANGLCVATGVLLSSIASESKAPAGAIYRPLIIAFYLIASAFSAFSMSLVNLLFHFIMAPALGLHRITMKSSYEKMDVAGFAGKFIEFGMLARAFLRHENCQALLLANALEQVESQWCPDRNSTRLNSSHITISYAVFCLKKKKKKK